MKIRRLLSCPTVGCCLVASSSLAFGQTPEPAAETLAPEEPSNGADQPPASAEIAGDSPAPVGEPGAAAAQDLRSSAEVAELSEAPGEEASAPSDAAQAPEVSLAPETEYPFPPDEEQKMADRHVNLSKARFRPGKGLTFESEDGDFALSLKIRGQLLYMWEKAEEEDGEYADPVESLSIRRARLAVAGHFWGKNNKFKVELAISPRDVGVRDTMINGTPTTTPLLDYYLDFTHLRDLSVRMGQYKVPFNRQRVVSSGSLQMVDRSSVNGEFNLDRDIGFDIRSSNFLGLDLLKYYAGMYIGEGRNSVTEDDFGLMYLARVEVLPFGTDFEDYEESALDRPASPKVSVGLGYAYLDDARHDLGILGRVPADGGSTDFHLANADVLFKYSGFSFFSEFMLRDGTRNPGDAVTIDEDGEEVPVPTEASRDGYGVMAQTGYLLPQTNFEIAARAGLIRPQNDESALSKRDELGAGLNYYFAHHSFKLQGDYFLYRLGEDKLLEHQARVQLEAGF